MQLNRWKVVMFLLFGVMFLTSCERKVDYFDNLKEEDLIYPITTEKDNANYFLSQSSHTDNYILKGSTE